MSTLAVVLVLSTGTAVALAGSNTVFSDDIVNGAVTSADIHDGGVQRADVHQGAWHIVAPWTAATQNCQQGPAAQFCGLTNQLNDTSFWENWGHGYESARFELDATGHVHLEGLVMEQHGDSIAVTPVIFYLPPGYRPGGHLVFPVECATLPDDARLTTSGRVTVYADGAVEFFAHGDCDAYAFVSGDGHLSLSGITFRAEQ